MAVRRPSLLVILLVALLLVFFLLRRVAAEGASAGWPWLPVGLA